MDQLTTPILAGFIFGTIAALTMIPMDFGSKNNKRDAILAAFIERFSIGFIIPFITLPLPSFLTGAIIGFVLSLPSAIITRTYIPILVMGTLGGLLIGFFS